MSYTSKHLGIPYRILGKVICPLFIILLFPIILVTCSASVSSADQVLRVGIFQNKPIVYFKDGAKGLFVDVLEQIAEKEKWQLEYTLCRLEDCIDQLKENEIDLMTSLGTSPERLQHLIFSQEAVWTFWGTVYSTDLKINDAFDLKGKTIAVRKGNKTTKALKKLLEDFQIPVSYLEFDNYEAALKTIAEGNYDAIAINNTYAISEYMRNGSLHKTSVIFNPFSAYFAISKTGINPKILDTLDDHVKSMKRDPSSAYHSFQRDLLSTQGTYWTGRRVAVLCSIMLLLTTALMALWRFVSMYKLNQSLKTNIGKREQAEKELLAKQYYLQKAQEIGKIGTWELDLQQDKLFWTEENYKIFGLPTETELTYDTFSDCVHHEDRDYVDKKWKLALSGAPYDIEHRLLVNNNVKWVREKAKLEFDESGKCIKGIGFTQDITDEKEKEFALRESQELLSQLAHNVKEVFWIVSLDWQKIYYISPAYEEVWGSTCESLINTPLSWIESIHDEDRQAVLDCIPDNRPLESEIIFPEYRIVTADKKLRWIAARAYPIYNAAGEVYRAAGIAEDVTRRKQDEQALLLSLKHFKTLLRSIPDLVWLKDRDGIYRDCNQMFEKFFGASEHNIIGKTDYDFVDKELADLFLEQDRKAIQANGPTKNEERITFAEGNYQGLFETVRTPMYGSEGELIGVLGVARDISERERAKEELLKLENQLMQAQKMESIGTLAGGIAHDFNNMLAIIIGNNELIMEELELSSLARESAEEIRVAGLRARDVVKQLLTFSRKDNVDKKIMDLKLVVEESTKLIRSITPANIEIEQKISADTYPIMGNDTQINQLLINLCNNAIDALPDKGGVVTIELLRVTLDTFQTRHQMQLPLGQYAKLVVSDNGIGMDSEILNRVFEPYFTTKDIGAGTGIGLAVVHGIVERHKGTILVDSKQGQGTSFTIFFPIHEGLSEQQTDLQDRLPAGDENILYVDDEPSIAKLGQRLLDSLGYTTESITDPKKALDMIESNPGKFDLLITDMAMPTMTGDQLVIESLKIQPDMPTIICTGYSAKITEKEAAEIGVHAYITKPIKKSELARIVRKVLDNAPKAT